MSLDASSLLPIGGSTTGGVTTGGSTTGGVTTGGSTTGGITTGGSTTGGSSLGLSPSASTYSYGTGIMAALGVVGTVLVTGALFAGVGLLSYAITKAALEP